MKWRLVYLPARTQCEPIIKLEHTLPVSPSVSKIKNTFRNPLIYAMELVEEMGREDLTQADLARKHGISRARVNQWLSLLQMPIGKKRQILAMGDYWDRRILAERQLRKKSI